MKFSIHLTMMPAILAFSSSLARADDFASLVQSEESFHLLKSRIEQDVLQLRAAAEAAYLNRCLVEGVKESCANSNYHTCGSSFPNPVCLKAKDQDDAYYGRGQVCMPADINSTECFGSTWDFTVSAVRTSSGLGEISPQEANTICTTQSLDQFFVQKCDADRGFWLEQGMDDSPWMYFGATDGVFRIYPARPDEHCPNPPSTDQEDDQDNMDYEDPRAQSWYTVYDALRPNKNVIMLLDNSGSMDGAGMKNLKDVSIEIVEQLHSGDKLAVMPFNSNEDTTKTSFNTVLHVDDASKEQLIAQIENMEVGGATNMYSAFTDAFDLLDTAIDEDLLVDSACDTVTEVMFLTDYRVQYPDGGNTVGFLDYFQRRFDQKISKRKMQNVNLFWVDISEADRNAILAFRSADISPGLSLFEVGQEDWKQIKSNSPRAAGSNPMQLIRTYSEAKPIDFDTYENHTAWVKPYEFRTNGVTGVSVSTPVFDRSVTPPLFVGVVGMDIPLQVLEQAISNRTDETIDELLEYSTTLCPAEELTVQDQLDALLDTSVIDVDIQIGRSAGLVCGRDDLPLEVFANSNSNSSSSETLPFSERACCSRDGFEEGRCVHIEVPVVDKGAPQEVEEDGGLSPALLGGIIAAAVVGVGAAGYLLMQQSGPPPVEGGSSGEDDPESGEDATAGEPTIPQAETA